MRLDAPYAVDDLHGGGRLAAGLPRAPLALDRRIGCLGGVPLVERVGIGLQGAAVLGRPGKQAQRHRGNLARARGDANGCRGVHAV